MRNGKTITIDFSLEELDSGWRRLRSQRRRERFFKIEDVCVCMLLEMICREKQFHDLGDRGANWKRSVLDKARKSGIRGTNRVRNK